ncbi:protein NRT1/ PTR FAMILY 4.5-like protein [Carex littledalei]|uniref:Protein NRT1/ PTR FAMILY 4.5-like protein n=1 Tax=Carex littledalei TaxID=544730 RepID=A0A833QQW3_9POAL|nr:protein NRT1/ PTR FAMILY 4.5-like protein [Carex littledalei]
MSVQGLVSWRGDPVDKTKHGGVKATLFLHSLVWLSNMANIANMLNLVVYLRGTLHMGVANASTTVTNFIGAISMFSLVGAFISDSYIRRFNTILIFGPLEILGYGLLALQAHLPSLHPPPCNIDQIPNNCKEVDGSNAALFFTSLYIITFGDGCLRASIASLGGDQFDSDDPKEVHAKISYFNWYTFSVSLGAFTGLIVVVWIENNRGWDVGFAVCALLVFAGLAIVAFGLPFYRNRIPSGSPLTRILQVFVIACKKRKLPFPESSKEEPHQHADSDGNSEEGLSRTKGLKFLDKASIENGEKGAWSFCNTNQIEETKILIRLLPIFISSVFGYLPFYLILTLSVQQGATMDNRLGKIKISPATLNIIPVIFQMSILVIYDRLIVPFLRKLTGYKGGITHLQRIGVGFAFAALAAFVAALVEMKRKKLAEEHGLMDVGTGVPMSVFWLVIQFFLVGIIDVTSFVGLLEFFYSEASVGTKSTGTSIFYCMHGLTAWLGSFLIALVNKVTRDGNGKKGWMEGANLNKSHLDRFYWLLFVIGLISFLNYTFWANRYVYRNDPRIVASNRKKSLEGEDSGAI